MLRFRPTPRLSWIWLSSIFLISASQLFAGAGQSDTVYLNIPGEPGVEQTLNGGASAVDCPIYTIPVSNWPESITFTMVRGGDGGTAQAGPDQDHNQDGHANTQHFTFDTHPQGGGGGEGKSICHIAEIIEENYLVLSIPVRRGATFSGSTALESAPVDNLIYRIEGNNLLDANWNQVIEEVSPPSTAVSLPCATWTAMANPTGNTAASAFPLLVPVTPKCSCGWASLG